MTRESIIDFLNTGTAQTPIWSLCGEGFTALDENFGAQVDEKQYICDVTSTSSIKSYKTSFSFTSDFIVDDTAVEKIWETARNHAVGAEAETEYIRADGWDKTTTTSGWNCPARKFNVAIEVTSMSGAGGEIPSMTGNLHAKGDATEGWLVYDGSAYSFTTTQP